MKFVYLQRHERQKRMEGEMKGKEMSETRTEKRKRNKGGTKVKFIHKRKRDAT